MDGVQIWDGRSMGDGELAVQRTDRYCGASGLPGKTVLCNRRSVVGLNVAGGSRFSRTTVTLSGGGAAAD